MDTPIAPPIAPVVAPSAVEVIASIVGAILATIPKDELAEFSSDAGIFLGQILKPIVAEEVDKAFQKYVGNSIELGKQNDYLQNDFPDILDRSH